MSMKIGDFTKLLRKRLAAGAETPITKPPAVADWVLKARAAKDRASRDLEYEASPGVSRALQLIRAGEKLILISGRAGTGKSRLINYLSRLPEGRRQIIVAPTGVAALNIGASTIHKAFRLPPEIIDSRMLEPQAFGPEMRKIDRLIIDEISMVRCDLLDAIDMRLRTIRSDPRPFGGVQVVMVGDFYQLPPVVTPSVAPILKRMGYLTGFAFSSRVLQDLDLKVATLTKVWRQNDAKLIDVLGRIRIDRVHAEDLEWLNATCHRAHREGANPMILTPKKAAAARYNMDGLEALRRGRRMIGDLPSGASGEEIGEVAFQAELEGSFRRPNRKEDDFPVPKTVELLPGARVMAVKNDPGGAFVNGSLGTVYAVSSSGGVENRAYAEVIFDRTPTPVRVEMMEWEEIKYGWNEKLDEIDRDVTGVYRQIPLVLGYASTIHKGQGQTLEDVRIDLGSGAFADGQLYVALSRATSAEGLSLKTPVRWSDVRANATAKGFLEWAEQNERIDFGDGVAGMGRPADAG